MELAIDKKLLLRFSMEVFNKVFIFLEENISFLSVPEQEVLDKGPHELEFLQNERRLINVIQSCRNDVENSLDSVPNVICLSVRLRQK